MADRSAKSGSNRVPNRPQAMHFVQDGYDRCTLHRRRDAHLAERISSGNAQILFVFDGHAAAVRDGQVFGCGLVDADRVPTAILERSTKVFLGERIGTPVFAVLTDENPRSLPGLANQGLLFMDLAKIGSQMPHRDASLMSYAQVMERWHRSHRFCGICGEETRSVNSGHLRVCRSTACGQQEFPTTDAAITVLVRSEDGILLSRQRGWSENLYSTTSGFVEPGESPEQAVYREVYNGTGTIVRKVRYVTSQPWPFPGSLMLGFTATADTGLISLKDEQLEAAEWFRRKDINRSLQKRRLRLPPRMSLAYRLIETWFNDGSSTPLDEINPE